MPKQGKPKEVKYEIIDPDADHDIHRIYDLVFEAVTTIHRHLDECRIAVAWRIALKADVDGKIVLGKMKKLSDLEREMTPHDAVIILNREHWEIFDEKQRKALIDHELCHLKVARDKNGDLKRDTKGRLVYRLAKHDIEEFSGVVDRHGCYKADLEDFAAIMAKKRAMPLFADVKEQPSPNGEAPGETTSGKPARPKRQRDHKAERARRAERKRQATLAAAPGETTAGTLEEPANV